MLLIVRTSHAYDARNIRNVMRNHNINPLQNCLSFLNLFHLRYAVNDFFNLMAVFIFYSCSVLVEFTIL